MNDPIAYPPDYDELAAAAAAARVELSAAEVHGIIAGTVSVPAARAPGALFFGRKPVAPTPEVERFLRLVAALQEDVQLRLDEADFEFQPLLPDADAELPDQVDGLAAWTRGYMLGLAAAGVRDPQQLGGEASEFLRDAMQIGEAEMDEDETIEEQERELAEIVEYLRAGVQLVYDELHAGHKAGE